MKKTILLTIILLATLSSFAQGFTNYKALIADDSGNVLSTQAVSVRFTIFYNDPSSSGVQVFQETHATTTDVNGIIILNIGEANPLDWFTMDWSVPSHYLQTEYNTGSGFVDMGTQAFRTVPYAQYAFKSQYSIYAQQAAEVDFDDITNMPADLADGDDDNQLSESEVDDYVSDNGYLTSEVDGSTTNELQTIEKVGSTVTLSNGGGSFTDANTTYTAGTGISISGTTITNTGDTDASDDVESLDDLSDAKTNGNSIYIGENAGNLDESFDNKNTGIGYNSLSSNENGQYNVALGTESLKNNNAGNNVAIGYAALYENTDGSYNTAIGSGAGLNSGSGNIFLGFNAGYHETGNNKLYIENSNSSTPLIGGDFDTNEVTINGSLSIKDGTEGEDKVLISDADGNAHWETTETTINYNPTKFNASYDTELRVSSYNAFISTTSSSTKYMYLPLDIPSGATVSNIKIYYRDNSTTANLTIQLYYHQTSSGYYMSFEEFTSSGNSSSVALYEITDSFPILNNCSYVIRVHNEDGAWGTSPSMCISGVIVTYE
jgi:hypothetical protein